jgi:aminopeptidase
VERSDAGRFTFPGIYQGQEVEDIFLRFKEGKVTEAKAAKGQELLHKLLETDAGASYCLVLSIDDTFCLEE